MFLVRNTIMLGRHHPLTRRLRALRRDGAMRRAERVLVAEGIHLTREALASGASVESVVASPALGRSDEGRRLLERARGAGVPVHEVAERLMESLQDARTPQPVLSLVRWPRIELSAVLDDATARGRIVVAHGIQDPGNLGSLLRSADAAGAVALLSCAGGADLSHPRTVRASMGSIFRLPSTRAETEEILAALRGAGYRTVGSSPAGGARYDRFDWSGPLALFLGGEGAGLPAELLSGLDAAVSVPMRAGVESLSVGAAAAVLLFEAARQES
jgi:TrmH family RNA methyltransferase